MEHTLVPTKIEMVRQSSTPLDIAVCIYPISRDQFPYLDIEAVPTSVGAGKLHSLSRLILESKA